MPLADCWTSRVKTFADCLRLKHVSPSWSWPQAPKSKAWAAPKLDTLEVPASDEPWRDVIRLVLRHRIQPPFQTCCWSGSHIGSVVWGHHEMKVAKPRDWYAMLPQWSEILKEDVTRSVNFHNSSMPFLSDRIKRSLWRRGRWKSTIRIVRPPRGYDLLVIVGFGRTCWHFNTSSILMHMVLYFVYCPQQMRQLYSYMFLNACRSVASNLTPGRSNLLFCHVHAYENQNVDKNTTINLFQPIYKSVCSFPDLCLTDLQVCSSFPAWGLFLGTNGEWHRFKLKPTKRRRRQHHFFSIRVTVDASWVQRSSTWEDHSSNLAE